MFIHAENKACAYRQLFKDTEMWYTHSLWSLYILSVETAYC